MSLTIKEFFSYDEEVLNIISALDTLIFDDPYTLEKMRIRVKFKESPFILIAYKDDIAIGFKAGFEENSAFHSWIGGVDPRYRGCGVARMAGHIACCTAACCPPKAVKMH